MDKYNGLSVIIPTLNSELFIDKTLYLISEFLTKFMVDFEIIVINDGSKDKTLKKCLDFKNNNNLNITIIDLTKNYGLKTATLVGLEFVKKKYAITYDDDLQFYLSDVPKLYEAIIKSNSIVVTGNYDKTSVNAAYDSSRNVIIKIFNYFFPKYVGANYYTSFKIFNLELIRQYNIKNIYFIWDIPPTLISSISVNIKDRKMRKSYNTIIHSLKLVNHVILKLLLKFLCLILTISILMSFLFSLSFKLIITIFFLTLVRYSLAIIISFPFLTRTILYLSF
jgi:glycosyltransferase involved in cell wall biosynthesis